MTTVRVSALLSLLCQAPQRPLCQCIMHVTSDALRQLSPKILRSQVSAHLGGDRNLTPRSAYDSARLFAYDAQSLSESPSKGDYTEFLHLRSHHEALYVWLTQSEYSDPLNLTDADSALYLQAAFWKEMLPYDASSAQPAGVSMTVAIKDCA